MYSGNVRNAANAKQYIPCNITRYTTIIQHFYTTFFNITAFKWYKNYNTSHTERNTQHETDKQVLKSPTPLTPGWTGSQTEPLGITGTSYDSQVPLRSPKQQCAGTSETTALTTTENSVYTESMSMLR